MITCPYCGLDKWSIVQFLTRRGSDNVVAICKCENCGKIFYLYRTRFSVATHRLEDVEI